MNETGEEKGLREYLLGSIEDESIMESIEERLMTDDKYFSELEIEEDELVQDFADGDLDEEQTKQFEQHFLINKERRQKLEFANALRRHVAQEESTTGVITFMNGRSDEKETIWSRLLGYGSVPSFRYVTAAAAVLLVGVVGILLWNANTGSGVDLTELNETDLSNLAAYDGYSSLELISGTLRSADKPRKISSKDVTENILIRLAVPIGIEGGTFSLKVVKGDSVTATLGDIKSHSNPNGSELRFLLPSSLLEKGEYRIVVVEKKQSVTNYLFVVE